MSARKYESREVDSTFPSSSDIMSDIEAPPRQDVQFGKGNHQL